MRTYSTAYWIALGAAGLLASLSGCAESHPDDGASKSAFLARAADCGDLLSKMKADAVARVRTEAEQARLHPEWYSYGYGYPEPVFGGAPSRDAGTAAPPTDNSGAPGAGGESEAPRDPSGYSETNTQVKGVDEADIVKTVNDGRNVWVLHGRKLVKLASWPAEATAIAQTIELDHDAFEMFAWSGGRVLLIGHWSPPGSCKDVPGPAPLPGDVDGRPAIDGDYYWCSETGVRLTLLDTTPETPAVLREVFVRGSYTTSRAYDGGKILRLITQQATQQPASIPMLYSVLYPANGSGPSSNDEVIARVNSWESMAVSAIASTTLADWLPPLVAENVNGELVDALPMCERFYAPTPGLTSYGLTSVLAVDLTDANKPFGGAMILGSAQAVYSNVGALVLAQPDWTYGLELEKDRTLIHRFDLDPTGVETAYVGSAFVRGVVKDQFSIDEQDGVVRVATTQNRFGGRWFGGGGVAVPPTVGVGGTDGVAVDGGAAEPQPVNSGVAMDAGSPDVVEPAPAVMAMEEPTRLNYVSTLGATSEGFGVLGETNGLAPEEMIYSARFLGNLAYIVTFRQVDPLFAIDLSDPANPTVLGELKIPGFSDYMHPLEDGYLLTIGRDGTDEGQVLGVALQIFDVRNPVDPKLAHKETFAPDGWSQANSNHKAFTFWRHPTRNENLLAIPFVRWGESFSSTLEVYAVDARTGFTKRGSVDHSSLYLGTICQPPYYYSDCGYQPQVERGFFIDDYVYSYSFGGVLVHSLDSLTSPVASVPFPAPY